MWNLVLAGVGASLVERVGRRTLWITSTAGMLVWWALYSLKRKVGHIR